MKTMLQAGEVKPPQHNTHTCCIGAHTRSYGYLLVEGETDEWESWRYRGEKQQQQHLQGGNAKYHYNIMTYIMQAWEVTMSAVVTPPPQLCSPGSSIEESHLPGNTLDVLNIFLWRYRCLRNRSRNVTRVVCAQGKGGKTPLTPTIGRKRILQNVSSALLYFIMAP